MKINKIIILKLIALVLFLLLSVSSLESQVWEKVPGTLSYVNFLKFSSKNKDKLYVGSDAEPTDFTTNNIPFLFFGYGFQISNDGGKSFSTPMLADYSVFDIYESNNSEVLLVSARKQNLGRVFYSSNNGSNWDEETKRCESTSQIVRFAKQSNATNETIVAAAINSNSGFRKTDNYFVDCNLSEQVQVNTRDISVSPKNSNIIYLAADNVSKSKVLVSKDGGNVWNDASVGIENYRVLSIQASPLEEETVLIGCDSVSPTGKIVGMGVFLSNDYGLSWRRVTNIDASVYDIQFHPSNPKFCAAAGGDKGVLISGTGGDYWEISKDGLPNSSFIRKVAVPDYPSNDNGIIVYASVYGDGIYKSKYITTSVDTKSDDNHIFIYPNPTNDFVSIIGQNIIDIEIFDLLGNKITTEQFDGISLNLSNLKQGLYVLKLSNRDGIFYKKVMKSN